jgi:hypothetical protein
MALDDCLLLFYVRLMRRTFGWSPLLACAGGSIRHEPDALCESSATTYCHCVWIGLRIRPLALLPESGLTAHPEEPAIQKIVKDRLTRPTLAELTSG